MGQGKDGPNSVQDSREVSMKPWKLNWKAKQLLMGHGNFRDYLTRFRMKDIEDMCEYGGGCETGEHLFWKCTIEEPVVARVEMRTALEGCQIKWPVRLTEVRHYRGIK